MYKNILLTVSLICSVFISQALANNATSSLKISNVWARKSMSSNGNSAAYMKITNPTKQQITIIGASSVSISDNLELHESFVDEQGISRMTSIDKIVVPAESEIELKPGGIHIMILGLKKNLSAGDKFTMQIELDEGMDPVLIESNVQ